MYTKIEVGKPFPGPVMSQEGCIMELWKQGLVVQMQMPGLQKNEIEAFKSELQSYSYFESDTPVPIAIWIWKFPSLTHLDTNFNAKLAKPEYIEDYLSLENGQVKNLLTFYLLDKQILKGIKIVGLEPTAIRLFHQTISKQLSLDYSQADYDKYLQGLYRFTSKELFQMGKTFIHKEKED